MRDEPTLTMRLDIMGEKPLVCTIGLGDIFMSSSELKQKPLSEYNPLLTTFEDAIRIMKTREYRREFFIAAANRLGRLLTEHLEDKEGWNGEARKENFK